MAPAGGLTSTSSCIFFFQNSIFSPKVPGVTKKMKKKLMFYLHSTQNESVSKISSHGTSVPFFGGGPVWFLYIFQVNLDAIFRFP